MPIAIPQPWTKIGLLVLASQALAFPWLFVIALTASVVLSMPSMDGWLESEPFLRSLGFAAFTSMLSIDSMFKAFYLTLPILIAGGFTLLQVDFGYRRRFFRWVVAAGCMGLLYAFVLHVGVYLGWLVDMSWT